MTALETYLSTRQVFTLESLADALGLRSRKSAALDLLKYHRRLGRVKRVTRGVYATVPPGVEPAKFQPDRYLVAAAVRPDAIFSHHAAFELLGAAHSDWRVCTVFTSRRRRSVSLDGVEMRFLRHPPALTRKRKENLGTIQVKRTRETLRATGPERTLVEGFRQPGAAGGLEELVESASGFGVLDLKLLRRLLETYDEKLLWAAVGWFLERYQRKFFVSPDYLVLLEKQRPKSPQYLLRSERGGVMQPRWNLILPESLVQGKEPDEV